MAFPQIVLEADEEGFPLTENIATSQQALKILVEALYLHIHSPYSTRVALAELLPEPPQWRVSQADGGCLDFFL